MFIDSILVKLMMNLTLLCLALFLPFRFHFINMVINMFIDSIWVCCLGLIVHHNERLTRRVVLDSFNVISRKVIFFFLYVYLHITLL